MSPPHAPGTHLGVLLLTMAACAGPTPVPHPAPTPPAPLGDGLKQAPSARLAGLAIGIAYSGYRPGQRPDRGHGGLEPNSEQILEDLRLLSRDGQFGLLRLYDSGPHARHVLEVIQTHTLPLKVMQGAWLQAEVSNHEGCAWLTEPIPEAELAKNRVANREEVDRLIQLAQTYSQIIVAVNVGNEVLVDWSDHVVPVEALRAHLTRVKAAVTQPVTVADNYVAWAEHGAALLDVVDLAAVHTYPCWEDKTVAEAMPYTVENLRRVQAALPGTRLMVGEAGWASIASEFGARASQAHQRTYYEALQQWAEANNITTFVFEAFDEDWKGNPDNPWGAEKHWGLFDLHRRPKQVMQGLYPDLPPAPQQTIPPTAHP